MKRFFYLAIILFSCNQGTKTLPKSTGLFSEIVFVVEDNLWESELSDLISNVFMSPVQGINQNESEYNILQIAPFEFKSFFQTHKNIVFVKNDIIDASIKNKWAQDQFVFQLSWKKDTASFLLKCQKIKTMFDLNEIRNIRKSKSINSNKALEEKIKLKFNIDVVLPEEYTLTKESGNFFWVSHNPANIEEIKHMLFYSFVPKEEKLQKEILYNTDSIFSKYLLGSRENSFVKIEPLYPPFFANNILRGLWRLENGFMGGPFLIKIYIQEERIVVGAAVVFAPQSKKRTYVKELEAIL